MNGQNGQAIERCACGSLLLAASERRWSACEPCQLRGQRSTARAVATLAGLMTAPAVAPTAVVNICRHDDLVWLCPECKAEEQTA